MNNGHLLQRGEPPQRSVLQMDTDKSVLHSNEKRYIRKAWQRLHEQNWLTLR
ncbi:hypothetical protein SAMD00079811_64220 [Scytonema sp. HK-05]|uniref:hypothetical protein n=1 Tax=Scytonema sp. HK-05 TaxID=1137095 RepID=UPI000B29C00E|nr:hypothetical protein [Scytonema sp. HK-05]BAY48796.1 hypothetical protein SAMD00079811_64220 [Scytonema sp. HK-05]